MPKEIPVASERVLTGGENLRPADQGLGTGHRSPVIDDQSLVTGAQAPEADPPRRRGFVERADGKAVRRVAIYLEPKDYEAFKRYCGDTRTMSDVGAEAVKEYLAARAPRRK
ncbi:MAG TPA: hypothetical protein VFS43_00230 [Polyangiaceae bacterium]|nr:hypothetical protein [Polyangiaceae bacterium]